MSAVMKANTPNVHTWLRVPQGSKLKISLNGTTQSQLVIGGGTARSDNSPPQNFVDAQVQPGPLTVQLIGQDSCAIALHIVFGTDAIADVQAFVEDSSGAHVLTDYHETFPRVKSSVETIVFSVVTV